MITGGTFTVAELCASERPLSITLMPTGHTKCSGRKYFGYVVAGFIDSDDNGGTRKPVALTGDDLGGAVWSSEEGMAHSLAAFLVDDMQRLQYSQDAWTTMLLVNHDEPITGLLDNEGDPLPAYTRDQWAFLESEGERLGCWAIEWED